jgi:hypothetical protein
MLLWASVWAWAGRVVYDATMTLAGPGLRLESAGSGFREQMAQAGNALRGVPLVGDQLSAPLEKAGGAGTTLQQAGADLVTAVTTLATILGWVTALVPILVVGLVWAFVRLRFVRRASAAQRFIDSAADLDLFALRAMAGQPMHRLAAISADPTGAWRRGDQATIRSLAELELRDSGLHLPAQLAGSR